jgi:hypothetical protein
VNAVGQSRTQQMPKLLQNLVWRVAVAVCLLSSAAQAGDWSFEGLTSNKIDYLNNVQLVPSGAKDDVTATSFSKGTLTYKTHDSQLDLMADVLTPHYFDYGVFSSAKFSTVHLSADYTKKTKRGSVKLGASYARLGDRYGNSSRFDECDPIAGTTLVDCDGEIFDTTAAAKGTFQNIYKANFGGVRRLDQLNTLTWDSSVTKTDFDRHSGPGSIAVKNQFGYERRLTKRTTGKFKAYANWQEIDIPQDTNRWVFGMSASIDSNRTRRTVLHAETGMSLTSTSQKNLAIPGFPEDSNEAFATYVMAGADYKLDAVTLLTWSARYGAQEQTNSWRHTVSSELGVTRSLNERASFSLKSSASMARSSGSGPANEIFKFNIAPVLNYKLNKDWTLDTGYAFTLKDSAAGTAIQNNVYVSVSKKFQIR